MNNERDDIETAIAKLSDAVRYHAQHLGTGNAGTSMGAIEMNAVAIKDAADEIASAIRDLAEAIRERK